MRQDSRLSHSAWQIMRHAYYNELQVPNLTFCERARVDAWCENHPTPLEQWIKEHAPEQVS